MAADDAWPSWNAAAPNGAGSELTRQAVIQFEQLLAQVEQRLNAPLEPTRSDEVLLTLVETLQALERSIGPILAGDAGRHRELGAALDALAGRLEVQAGNETRAAAPDDRIVVRQDSLRLGLPPTAADPWPIRAVLAFASAAAALSVMAAAALAVSLPAKPGPAVSTEPAELQKLRLRPSLKAEERAPESPVWPPRAAALRSPRSSGPSESYEATVAALARGEATGLSRLTGLALAGDSKAQLHLAGLYEAGQSGLAQDMVAARQWTRRAAGQGERVAMHNLGLFLMQGDGGPRDVAEAAIWFRRAAGQGVVDSQYNLGLLYEAGQGVDRNLREAYRWFTVAANAGDGLSREKAVALEAVIRPGERADLTREAAAFQPGAATPADPVIPIPPATTLAETQALLSRQGYYLGPIDGVPNPALRAAAAAYARDRPAVGDPPT